MSNTFINDDSGTFSGSVQYVVKQMYSIAGVLCYSCPVVSFGGKKYIAKNVSVQPTLGVSPNADAAFAVFSDLASPTVLPVLVATTVNLTLSGEQTIDGVLTSASRVLVKNRTIASSNGIYVTAAGAWALSTDANSFAKLVGLTVEVLEGSAGAGKVFASNAQPGGTLGTTAVTFTAVGFGQVITANFPMNMSNGIISVVHTNGYIKGFSAASIGNGAVTLTGGSSVLTSNLTLNATSISIPLNSSILIHAALHIDSASASNAAFTLTGTNCTMATQAIDVGAAKSDGLVYLMGYVTSTSTASPTVSIVVSSVSGTNSILNDSSIMISQG